MGRDIHGQPFSYLMQHVIGKDEATNEEEKGNELKTSHIHHNLPASCLKNAFLPDALFIQCL